MYDATTGRLSEVIDGAGNPTLVSTDVSGRAETVIDPNGKLTTINHYDDLGDLTEKDQLVSGRTLTTVDTYDGAGHLLSSTDPLGHTTRTSYDSLGDPVTQTDADGKTTTYQYDGYGQLTGVVGPDGTQQLVISRDAGGNETRVARGGGSAYAYTYTHGLLSTITDPAGVTEQIAYDANGNPASVTDASGHETATQFNESGQLIAETDPSGNTTTYAYDANGNLTSITDGAGHATTIAYNALGNQVTSKDALGNTATSTYDAAGHLLAHTDRDGQTTTFGYDADGHLVSEVFPGGDYTTIQRDAFERTSTIVSPTQALGFVYDDAGRVTQASASAVGVAPAVTTNYTYDANGNRLAMTAPDGTTTYGYDALSRLTSVTPSTEPGGASFSMTYGPNGQLATLQRPDGINDVLTYNGSQLTSRIATGGHGVAAGATYSYGPTGLRATGTDSTTGVTATYTNDPLGQLTQSSGGSASPLAIAYDAAGNRSGATYDAAEELTADNNASYTYDDEGQLLRKQNAATGAVTTYDWNARHQLTALHLSDGTTEAFAYDALGRRVSTSSNGHVTSYVYDGSNIHLEYADPASAPAAVYTDGLATDQVLEMARGDHRYSYLVDGEGSTIALADETGAVVQRYGYDAFGGVSASGGVANPFTYTGREWDAASGLYYYRARYYDPGLGRFISRDPVLNPNPYVYANNDPTNASDPSGADSSFIEIDESEELDNEASQIPVSSAGQLVKNVAQAFADQGKQALLNNLSPKELAALARAPYLERAFLGTAIHRAVAEQIEGELGDSVEYNLVGPDYVFTSASAEGEFVDSIVELTTPGQVAAHAARAGYDIAEIVTYTLEL